MSQDTQWIYMFKAAGLQSFIYETNKLREVVGASQLISKTTNEYLRNALQEIGAKDGEDYEILQQVAGAATILFFNEAHARGLYAIWPALLSQLAPGLQADQWLGEIGDSRLFNTLKEGWEALSSRKNQRIPIFPQATPPMERAPRNEGPAVVRRRVQGKEVSLDRVSVRRLAVNAQTNNTFAGLKPGEIYKEWSLCEWARELTDVATGEHSYLSIIHADGNRLGSFLINLAGALEDQQLSDDQIAQLYRDFSDRLRDATREAVVDALKASGLNETTAVRDIVPIRPVIIGGDDVTLIVPSQVALKVSSAFLESFEQRTRALFKQLFATYKLPIFKKKGADHLSACAGIVFQRHMQPLLTGYENAEKLCSWAKRRSRRPDATTASTLMFARAIDSAQDDFKTRLEDDFIDPSSGILLSAGPFAAIDSDSPATARTRPFVSLTTLEQVHDIAWYASKGSVRGLIDALQLGESQAIHAFDRQLEVLRDDSPQKAEQLQKHIVDVGISVIKPRLEAMRAKKAATSQTQNSPVDPTVAGLSILSDVSVLAFVEG